MRVIEGLIPPQGFHYISPTGYRVPGTGEATSFTDLVKRVQTYRLENRLDVGNAEADCEDFICNNFPNMCGVFGQQTHVQTHAIISAGMERPVDYINAWVNGLIDHFDALEFVTDAEARRRAAACRKCPYNSEWRNGCGPCVATAQRSLGTVRQGKDVPNAEEEMRYCGLHRIDTRTAIWLERRLFGPVNAPSHCWLA